ncbi:MAG: aminotransferase class III-fold pyridoxal phosphate-dependent enzyme, partial [Chloroflexi bacterium]|nr:aminotransferase class III-fold pyridoxal phosphate-dependent enzyme [Chloroflexota bacterium]
METAADRAPAADPDSVDPVLRARRPTITSAQAPEIAERTFGLRAHAARDLGSERDQAFLLADDADRPVAVMKISNTSEDPSTLDMEALAVLHAARVDPDLPLAMPWRIPGTGTDSPMAADRRASFYGPDGVHHVRMYDALPGRQRVNAAELSDTALIGWGETTARLDRALRGFFHPSAQRTMVWDVQHALRARALLGSVRDEAQRSLAERALDRFEAVVMPLWPSLRAQVVHGDLTVDNALTDAAGRITGIVDFGDMSHSTILTELASVLDSLVVDRGPDELFRVSRLILDGYQQITPLEDGELRLVGEALAARAAVTIAISSWRAELGLEDRAFAERYNASVGRNIETLLAVGWDEAARRFGAERAVPAERGGVDGVARDAEVGLIKRRDAVLGPALEPLTYEVPIHVASARGIWLTDVQGRTYLDAYNNVPCVGHGHPRVTEAIARQGRRLNTNLRYLHGAAIELAERLVDTCPLGLDTVLYVNSGSEANDLAWRLATTFTGQRGGLCTDFAYHG